MAEKKKQKPEQEHELDVDAVFADLNRQAHDKELEALANLTLLQSGFDPEELTPEEQERRELDERLQKIIGDLTRD